MLCGVSLENLKSLFIKFDKKCEYIVYPGSKSFSFIVFSSIEKATQAFEELNNTRPEEFPQQAWPIALLYVKKGK